MNTVFFKDKFCPENEVNIPLTNRAFRYGDGCFESISIMNGMPVFWQYHYNRLCETLSLLRIELEQKDIDLLSVISACIERNKIVAGGLLRITVYRGGGGKYFPETDEGELLIQVFSAPDNQFRVPVITRKALVFNDVALPSHVLGNHKTLNKTVHILAARKARTANFDEALITNDKGSIAEAISSNVFILKGQRVITPPLSDGGLQGTIRQVLLDHQGEFGIRIEESSIKLKDVLAADEIWTTNAVSGLCAISQFMGKEFPFEKANEIQLELNKLAINSSLGLPGSWT